jgi:hypothetical protein
VFFNQFVLYSACVRSRDPVDCILLSLCINSQTWSLDVGRYRSTQLNTYIDVGDISTVMGIAMLFLLTFITSLMTTLSI